MKKRLGQGGEYAREMQMLQLEGAAEGARLETKASQKDLCIEDTSQMLYNGILRLVLSSVS
jgi:hypothetical protein